MASVKLFLAVLALTATIVAGKPCKKQCVAKNVAARKACPDEFIRLYFDEVKVTVRSDWEWIQNQMKYIASQKQAAEYAAIVELLNQLEAARRTFEGDYDVIHTEIYERVVGFQNKYGLLSISYTERIVTIRKTLRQRLYPDLRNFRSIYIKMLPLFNDFYQKYNLERQIRARVLPRAPEYNFVHYLPPSAHMNDITLIISTTWKDYQYLRDLINKLEFEQGTPEYDLKVKALDGLIDSWSDFNFNRREMEAEFYQRFLDAKDDLRAIDAIYADYIAKLRGHTYKFANNFFNGYGQIEDLYIKRKLAFTPYIDFDLIAAERDVRGLYLPSPRLSKYYTKLIVTSRMDYLTAKRLWDNLKLTPNTPEWELRNKVLPELKQRLDNLEQLVNRNIRDSFNKLYDYYNKNPLADLDKEYEKYISELMGLTDTNILPILYEFRENYYVNDDTLADLLKKRGIEDATRNIIACDTYGYDNTILVPDRDLRDLFSWAEKLLKKNYYLPVNDLVQLRFPDNSDEWKIRHDSLKRLERVWLDYRGINNHAIRKYISLIRKNKFKIGSAEYERELKKIREHCRPKLVSLIDRFKKDCFDINGYLDTLYSKSSCKTCVRGYSYVETSFEITVKSSVSVKSC